MVATKMHMSDTRSEATEDEIAVCAYFIWEQEGNRKDGRSTIGCRRNSSSPRPSGTSPSGTRRGEHRSLRMPEEADEELQVAWCTFSSLAAIRSFARKLACNPYRYASPRASELDGSGNCCSRALFGINYRKFTDFHDSFHKIDT
jgi:hypothetical protein